MALNANLSQRLTTGLTPQLQQAIRLLPMSNLELAAEVQLKLDSNPMLEREDEFAELDPRDDNDRLNSDIVADIAEYGNLPNDELLDLPMNVYSGSALAGTDVAGQTDGDDIRAADYTADASDYLSHASFAPEDWSDEPDADDSSGDYAGGVLGQHAEANAGQTPTTPNNLQDHVRWQMNFKRLSAQDQWLAEQLIDSMDERGFIALSSDDLWHSIQTTLAFYQRTDIDIELADIEAVIKRIQTCEPLGVGARNLAECLALQLARLPADTPYLSETRTLLSQPMYLDQLANNQLPALLKATGLTADTLKGALALLRTLSPNPAVVYEQNLPHATLEDGYDIPDVLVMPLKTHTDAPTRWQVILNPDTLPKLRINGYYASLIRRADTSAQNQYLKDQLNDARLFMRAIEERNHNLLKVARCIVRRQQGFFEHGATAMQPMVLRDVAEEVDLHESTVSRITTSKTMLTPRGLFSLKYFFSSQVGAEGEGVSSTAISALIKQMIGEEDPKRPLSDSAIVKRLQQQGIQIARRTVTKYREAMGIAASSVRKQRL
ncbi:RNA polymerase factor sigma-54 [Moraxella atlantae]|uniref:RNA polymerase sigma-54 factor n=1 Tax=Faucicola atlantae TaxID=34059 RepID=A0A378Q5C8_9GAMM|nr:RNA polymerase factor sigma-54 [Moraxella atlantae]OPH34420.1 RNA polymerase sigma-54 factor [Moraxella atlantae]STY95939.1 RNA polymerase factor sigma-54 [Moraxella atlantae]